MNKTELEIKANAIEVVLAQHRITGRVTGGVVAPRSVQFTLATNTTANKVEALAGDLAGALGVPEVQVARQGMSLVLSIKRTDANPVKLLTMLSKMPVNLPACTATLGMCDDGAPLLLRFSSEQVGHVLISGPYGCCASSLLRTMAVSLALCNKPHNVKLVLVGRAFSDLARLPHVLNYATDNGQAGIALGDVVKRIGRGDHDPRIVVLIDDLDYIVPSGNLSRLLKDGHAVGVHIAASGNYVVATASSAYFGTLIHSKREAGDFEVMDNGKGESIRFTAATITPAEVEQVVIGAMPKREPTRLHQAWAIMAGAN